VSPSQPPVGGPIYFIHHLADHANAHTNDQKGKNLKVSPEGEGFIRIPFRIYAEPCVETQG